MPILVDDKILPKVTGMPKMIQNKFETIEGVPTINNFQQLKQPSFTKNSDVSRAINDGKMEGNVNVK